MKSYEEQLADVQRAIEDIELRGQEYDIEVNKNRRRLRRADLRELYRREAFLKRMIERSRCGSIVWTRPAP